MENIIHLEFFEEMSSPMKHIYLAYSAVGGAIYETCTTSKFKYLFGGLIGFQFVSFSLAIVMTILRQQGSDMHLITSCLMYLFFLAGLLAKALMIYIKRDTFRALFDHTSKMKDDEFIKPNYNLTVDQIDEISVENLNIKGLKYNLMYTLAVTAFKLSQKLVDYTSTGEFNINYQWDFIFPVPFVDSQTITSYILVYSVVLVISLIIPLIMYGSTFLPAILSVHLKNHAIRLQNDMKYHTAATFECMEECDRREERILNESPKCERVRDFQLHDIQNQRDRHIEEFMHKVRQWIKYHQKWVLCVNLFNECVSPLLSVYVVTCYAGIIGPGYNVAKMMLDSKEPTYDHIIYTALNTIHLLVACATANVLIETSDDISTAIYSMPWYHLPTKHQKVLLQFLALTQNSPKMHIFKVFPFSLEQFPQLMNDAYDYIQLTRVLEMKVQ